MVFYPQQTQEEIMSELVSVIVPIYKVEPYLRPCLDSILAQTYHNLEIILVDDGSPDSCGAICDEYAEKDSRIRVIHKENGGLSDARNAGMDIATGDYYYFVDSDDILPDHSIMIMYGLLQEHKAQMVIGGFERFMDGETKPFFSTEDEGLWLHVYDREGAFRDFYRDGCQAWAVLYQRKIHENIRFPKGEINEDEAIVFHIFENCDTVVVTNRVVYSYRCREESITTTAFHNKKLAWVKHCADNWEFAREKHPAIVPMATARYRGSILWALREIALSAEDFRDERDTLLKTLRRNATIFDKAPFSAKSDRLRYLMLKYLPFSVFKATLRLRHDI
jgi:glycosyltransferase involved in cell wall biosynthesis